MLRTTEVDYPDGGQTIYGYPSATEVQISQKIDTTGRSKTWNLFVDGLGRLSQTQLTSDPDGTDYTLTTYDAMGRHYQVYNATRCSAITTNCGESTWGYTTYQYDALSRPTSVTEQDGSAISTSYSGNSTTVTDEAGKTRESFVDSLGRLVTVTEDPGGLNYSTSYTYDALNNLTGVTQVGSRQRSFVYDSLSRMSSATNPESGTTCYGTVSAGTCQQNGYDADANLVYKTDARGIVTTYSYDVANRPTQKSYSDGTPSEFFSYDVSGTWGVPSSNTVGRLVEAWTDTSRPWAASIFSYDAMGRVTMNDQCTPALCGSGAWNVNYTYDLLGDMTSYTNGVGAQFSQSFDSSGRLDQITSNVTTDQRPATLYTSDPSSGYYPNGAIRKATFGNGLTETNMYESRLQPCRLNLNSSGSFITDTCNDGPVTGTVQDFDYAYGTWGSTNNGDVTGIYAVGTQNFARTYAYDSVNRLSSMAAPGDSCSGLSWTYDAWGNRTDQTVTGGTCNSFHQVADGNNRLSGYQYDAAGNMINDGSHSYFYDGEDRLYQVDGSSGYCSTGGGAPATACYVYDAEGRRIEKPVQPDEGGGKADLVYDLDGHVIMEYRYTPGFTGWAIGYVYARGQMAAVYANATVYFLHHDALGSIRLATAMDQSVYENFDYLPFGEQILGGTDFFGYKFTGKERDPESGLDNFGARYNSSNLGRFMSPDPGNTGAHPMLPQSLNMYAYALDNPLNDVDPDGLDPCTTAEGAASPAEGSEITAGDCEQKARQACPINACVTASTPIAWAGNVVLGAAKAFDNQVIDLANTIKGPVNAALSLLGINISDLGQTPNIQASNNTEQSTMNLAGPALIAGGFLTGEGEAASGVKVAKSLASDAQVAERGAAIAGRGSSKILRDAQRLAAEYGGNAADWSKMTSSSYQAAGTARSTAFETHWYENAVEGIRAEYKTVIVWMRQ